MPGRFHIVSVPPPDVAWVVTGPEVAGADLPGGSVEGVSGVGRRYGSGVAVLPGEPGRAALRHDAWGRRVWAVPHLLDDDAETSATPLREASDVASVDRGALDVWLERLAAAGVTPDRVACPDLVGQLASTRENRVDAVVCACLDADPLLPVQAEWASRYPRALRDGLRVLARLAGARQALVAVADDDHRRLARLLRRLARREAESSGTSATQDDVAVRLVPVLNAYPQADPTLLARTLAQRSLAPGQHPPEVGLLVVDAVAAVAVGHVAHGCGVVRTGPVGVRDHRSHIGVLAEAWNGTRLCDILMFLGLLHRDPERVAVSPVSSDAESVSAWSGDVLRARGVPLTAVVGNGPVTFHLTASTRVAAEPTACVRCGWCNDVCPTGVQPVGLLDADAASGAARVRLSLRHAADACIGCGLCDYVCPSRLPLRLLATTLREELRS